MNRIDFLLGAFDAKWFAEDIAEIRIACGTGLQYGFIFLPPETVVSCEMHTVKTAAVPKGEPLPASNLPLLIDSAHRLYVYYDRADNIQVLPLLHPAFTTIYPPAGLLALGFDSKKA